MMVAAAWKILLNLVSGKYLISDHAKNGTCVIIGPFGGYEDTAIV